MKHDEWRRHGRAPCEEKEFTLRDQLSRERRELPWELVEKQYTFQGERGTQTLSDVFEGRGQLVIYHAMFNPDTAGPHTPWTADAPCFVCSFWMDNFNGISVHLNHRDITVAAVSRAPYPKLAAYKKRMGWGFPWLSSLGSDFNVDYRVSFTDEKAQVDYNYRLRPWGLTEAPGISVFLKDGGQIYHTYSTYERGSNVDLPITTWISCRRAAMSRLRRRLGGCRRDEYVTDDGGGSSSRSGSAAPSEAADSFLRADADDFRTPDITGQPRGCNGRPPVAGVAWAVCPAIELQG